MVSLDVITAPELAQLVGTDTISILDARDPADYDEGHVPGAVNLHPSTLEAEETLEQGETIANQLRAPADVTAYLRAAGVDNDKPVCVYDDGGGYLAARLWWILDYLGHPRPRMLDGGLYSWTAEVDIISTLSSPIRRGGFVPSPAPERRMEFADIITAIASSEVVLCNALPRETFLEETIPGSSSFPFTETFAHDNYPLLRTRHELADEFRSRGVTRETHLICFCRIGYTASQLYFAARYAGLRDVSVYDGSMTEWSARGGELVPGRDG